MTRNTPRAPAFAGSFYPSAPETLKKTIQGYFDEAGDAAVDAPFAVVAPHAGYVYSGAIAAKGFYAARNARPDTVIVIGRSHRFQGEYAALDSARPLLTPLGALNADEEVRARLSRNKGIAVMPSVFDEEHALETQLPFIKTLWPSAGVVGIIMGSENRTTVTETAEALIDAVSALTHTSILIVCSTDLSHYHAYEEARVLDCRFRDALTKCDVAALARGANEGTIEACGIAATLATVIAAKALGKTNVRITGFGNSGDSAGDKDRVVGYLSATLS